MRVPLDTGERVSRERAYTDPAPTDDRLAFRRSESPNERPFLAEAGILVDGRLEQRLRRMAREARVAVPGEWLSWARAARRGWQWRDDTLVRELTFRDFDEGMRFLEQVARRAQDYTRRPDMSISANHVRLKIANPHRAGITLAELRLAAKVNAVVDEIGPMADGVS